MAIIIAGGDGKPDPKKPKVTVASGAISDIPQQQGTAISENYTKGFIPFLESQKNYVAGNQGGTAEFGNMLGQSVLGALTGTVETLSYWGDLDERIGNRFREQKEYENWLGNAMKDLKEAGDKSLPIYKSEANEQFNPSSREWWFAHGGDTIGSVLGLMLPGLAVAKAGKLAGLGSTGQAISAAVASRTAESTMEANEAFNTAYATAKQQGLTEEEAKKIASKAGAKTWDSNWVFALQDVMQFNALTKGFNTAAKGMKGQTIKNILGLAENAASEGVEEGGQYVVSKEAVNAAMHTEEDYFGKDFGKRLIDYIDDDEFKTSVALGALGGTVFQGAGHLAGKPLEFVAEKVKNIAKRGLQREQANSIDDTATSQKTSNIDAADQLVDRLNKGKLNEYLVELDEQIKRPEIDQEGRQNLQNQIEDTKQILTEQSKLKNSPVPQELHKPILLRHLEKNQLTRLDKHLTKEVGNIEQSLQTSGELPEGLVELKKIQVAALAYSKLAETTNDTELIKKAETLQKQYNDLLAESKKNPLFNIAFPNLEKSLTTTKDDELIHKTFQLAATKEKNQAITNELKDLTTKQGIDKFKKEAQERTEIANTKDLVSRAKVKTEDVQEHLNKVQSPVAKELLQKKLEQIQQTNKEENQAKIAQEIDDLHEVNPEVDINPEIDPNLELVPDEVDFDPFANVDPSTLVAFGQAPKIVNPVIEKISVEQEKKDPKPSKLQTRKAEKIKNEYLEANTSKTWLKEFASTLVDGNWIIQRDAEGYPIEQEYFDKKGNKVPAHKVFATDHNGILLVNTPIIKVGDHVLLKHENNFEYTFSEGFVPTGPENQIINIYLVNPDGSLRHDKPLNQLASSDNKELSAEQKQINIKLREQVYNSGGELRTRIVAKNIGEAKRGDKLNTLGILEFDYYNNKLQKLPFNPILGGVDQNGNIVFSGDTVSKLPKDYKDKVENLVHSFPEIPKNLKGSVVVVRQSPDTTLRIETLNERLMTDQEIKFVQQEIANAFNTNNFNNLDEVLYLPDHPVGVYKTTDRSGRVKKPDLFSMDRSRLHRIGTQLAIPIASGNLLGWAIVEKNNISQFLAGSNTQIKRYWYQKNQVVKMVNPLSITEQANIKTIYDKLLTNKQRNIIHDKLNSELPYIDPATNVTHSSYYDFLKTTNTLQTKLRGSLTPSYGQDTSYSYGQAAIYLDPNPNTIEVEITPEEEIKVTKSEPIIKAETSKQSEDRKPSFTKKKYKSASIDINNFKTLTEKELSWFKDTYGGEFIDIAKNIDRFVAENGKEAFGMYYNALITVSQFSPEGTLYHEAGHFIFDPKNGLISERLRNKVLDEASKIYNIKRSNTAPTVTEESLSSIPTTPQGTQKLFVYGTLMQEKIRKEAIGKNVEPTKAIAPNEKKESIHKYPEIEHDNGKNLKGDILEVTKEQLEKLDNWEAKYKRAVITLSTGEKAFVYKLKNDEVQDLTGDEQLEEKVMEDFEKYMLSNGEYVPEVSASKTFFQKLLNLIKKIFGFKSAIQKLYENIDTPNLTTEQRKALVERRGRLANSQEMKFKLAPGFINSEQEQDAILSFKTEVMNLIYTAASKINQVGNMLAEPGKLDKLLEEVKAKFRMEGYQILTKKPEQRSQEEVDRLATLWATGVMEGAELDQDNIDYVGSWNDNQYGEFIDKGFKSKVLESLADLGFVVKVNADLVEMQVEDEAERMYDIDHTLLNPSNSISNRVKLFLHSIPQPVVDNKGTVTGYEHTHLGTIKPLDFKAVDARLSLKLADSLNPYTRLVELSKIDPIAKVIVDRLNDIKAKGDIQTFKEVLVKYRRDTVDKKTILHEEKNIFVPIPERGPSDEAFAKVYTSKLIDANRNSVFRSIIGNWREEAIRTNFITHSDKVTTKMVAINNLFSKLKTDRSKLSFTEMETQFKDILKPMGITVDNGVWKELNSLPDKERKRKLESWIYGERSRSLESLLDDTNKEGISPFTKETGTLLEDLSKASAIYNNRVKTGAYLNENGELEYPINTPSYLTELNNIFEDPDLTEEFIQKHWQDDFYRNNQFLLALRDPKLRTGIRLSLLAAFREQNRDAKMFSDRTEIDSILSRLTAYSSNNETFSSFFIGTPADKAKNPMMSLPRKKGADALAFLKKVLEGTIDSELVRIKNIKDSVNGVRKGTALPTDVEQLKNAIQFLYIPDLNSVPNLTSSLTNGEVSPEEYRQARTKASEIINSFIEDHYNKFLDFLVSNDIVISKEEKGKRTILNKRIPKGTIKDLSVDTFLKEFFFNDTAWRLEMSKVFMGDRALYKNADDYFKRAYQLVTPGYKGFTLPDEASTITRGIYPKQMKTTLTEINSLSTHGLSKDIIAEFNKGINKTDAQSVATIHGYRKLATSLGLWSDLHEQIYNIAWGKGLTAKKGIQIAEQGDKISTEEANRLRRSLKNLTLQPLKPFQFNERELILPNGKVEIIKEQYKDSITPLIPELLAGHTGYSDLHEYMMHNGFDIMSAADTVKVGLSGVVDFSRPAEEWQKKTVSLDTIRFPQLLPEKSKEEVSGSQFHKLIMGDINDSTTYNVRGRKISGSDIKILYQRLWEDKINEASASLQKKLGVDSTFTLSEDPAKRKEQFIKLQLMLKEELSTRDLNENYQDALDLVRTQLNTIDFSLPLSFPQLGEKFQGILTNVFKKKIFKEGTKSPGYSAVNLADFGVNRTDELKYIHDENGEIVEAEIGLPINFIGKIGLKAIEHYNPSTMRVYWDKLNENQKKALQFIIYRIPTSNKSSMLPVRVAMITPPALNNVVMIPGELTLQMGLDFDVDKSQLISRVIDDDGRVNKDNTDTRLFDIYWSILTNPAHLNAMLAPLATTRLEEIRDNYKKLGILSEESNSPFYMVQADSKAESKNREEKIKVGIASRAATAHSVFNTLPKELINTKLVEFGLVDGPKTQVLGRERDNSNILISENLGIVQQAALDAAKTPLLALFNITKNLLPAAETYLLFGKSLDTVTDFFMQPVIRAWSEAYIQENENDRNAFDKLGDHNLYLKGKDRRFSTEELKANLTSKVGENKLHDAKMLAELRYLLDLSKQITNFTNVVSIETMNDATSIESLLVVQNQVRQATDPEQTMYLDSTLFDLDKAPKQAKRLAAFYKHGIEDGISYAGQFYPVTSIPYRVARENILETLQLKPNIDLYKKIDQFINFHVLQSNSKLFQHLKTVYPSSTPRTWSYVNEEKSFFNHIQKMVKKYPALLDNPMIQNLRDQSTVNASLSLVGVRNTDDNSRTEVINGWHDLLNAETPEIKQLGHDLVAYSIFTSGFTYHTASFVDLVPIDFWKKAGLDQVWKDLLNNPSIDHEALLVDFVRHKFESIKFFPKFHLSPSNESETILKSSIKENREGLITSFVVDQHLYKESNPPRFVIVRGNLYESNPANAVHYKLLQPAGSRYLYEVSADGRRTSLHPDNKNLGSADPFKQSTTIKEFPLLLNVAEGKNEFIGDYLPEQKNDPKTVLEKLLLEETNPDTKQVLTNMLDNVSKLTTQIDVIPLEGKLGVFEVQKTFNTISASIKINPNANVESASQMRHIITHELVHAYTVGVLQNPRTEQEINFNRNIERLSQESNIKDKYEFIAELASNPKFRESLKKKDLWSRLLRFFRKLFGQKESYDKVLDQMYAVVDHAQSLQAISPGEFALEQDKKNEKKEPKKRLDALEKAVSSLEAQARKLKEKMGRDAAGSLEVNIEQLKKLSATSRSEAVIKYLLIVNEQVKNLKQVYDKMAKTPDKINPKVLNPMRDQLLSYSLLDTFSNEIHNNPSAFVPDGGDAEQLLKALAELKNEVYSLKAKTNNLVINRVAEFTNEALGGKEDIDDLRENLQVADRDINWWSRMETSFSEIRDRFIKSAALIFKDVKYKAYRQTQEDLYRDTVKKETANIAVYDDKWVRRVISYNSTGMFTALNDYERWLKLKGKNANSLADKFSPIINPESLKQDSKGIEFIAPWSKEGKKILSIGANLPDKSPNPEYALRQFYETVVLGYLHSQEKIKLPSMRPGLRIPTVGRTLLEGFLKEKGITNKLDVLKEQFTNSFIERFDDAEYQQVNQHGEPESGLPLRYTSRQDGENGRLTKKEVSLDIPATVGLFMYEMNKRDGMLAVQDDLELLEQAIADRKVMKTTKSSSYLSPETKGIPLANGEYATINGIESNSYSALKDLIDRELYGITKKREGDLKVGEKKVSIAKGVDAFLRFTGFRIMLGKVAIPLTNLVVSELTLAKEVVGGNIINRKNWTAGQKFYAKNAFPVLADLGRREKKTHLGRLLTFFNPMETLPAVGHIGVDSTRMRTVWDKVISTGGATAEYKMAVTAFGAVMDKFNVLSPEGKVESLDNGVEITNTGKISLKKGYKYLGKEGKQYEGKTELSDKDINQVIHYTLRTYQIMNGIYNIGDKPAANAYVLGRLVNFMRSWLPAGIAARWNTKDFDERLGQVNEGHYISSAIAFKNVYGKNGFLLGSLKNLKMLMWMGNNDPETLLLPEELTLPEDEKQELINMRKAGMRKTLFELYGIAVLGLLIFSAFGDDDDSYTKYMLARVRRELMTFIDPTTAWDVLRSPTVALNTIETVAGFLSTARESVWAYASGDEQAVMERGPGKGLTKINYKARRLFGVDADLQFDDMGTKSRIIMNGGFK